MPVRHFQGARRSPAARRCRGETVTQRWGLPARLVTILLLIPLLGAPALSLAATPAAAEAEISHLLAFIENSGCSFNRNGSWYEATRGAEHLRDKYQWLATRGKINSAEDFVEKAATASSMSGKPYEVKCGAGPVVQTGEWLRSELARYRACAGRCGTALPAVAPPVPVATPRAPPTRNRPVAD